MDILFICGSLEPGKDGVGDYVRRLCGELIRSGQQAQILSICDNHINAFISESQVAEKTSIITHRIPVKLEHKQRLICLQNVLKNFEPDLISLQYVPYSFNPKGLPFWLPSYLKKIKGNHKWHIMFHELWVGMDVESRLKHKFIGKLQQKIVKKIINTIKPQILNTQNKLYQLQLKSKNINTEISPICGNIPLTGLKNKDKKVTQFVLFGTIHYGAPFEDFVSDLLSIVNNLKKPLKFVFVGVNGTELSYYRRILDNSQICYEVMGVQSENAISQILINSDFGISTTPYYQTEKSGVYAAYKEHQINTISVARNWTPTKGQYNIPQIIKYEKNNLNLVSKDIEMFDLHTMALKFINSIALS